MKYFWLLLVILGMVAVSFSCTAASTSQETPILPLTTKTIKVPSLTPKISPSATKSPTSTTAPPNTPSPTKEIIRTPTPDIIGTNYWQEITSIVETIIATVQPNVLATFISPNGDWRAETLVYPCSQIIGSEENSLEQMNLIEIATGDSSLLTDQLLNCGGIGAGGLAGLYWSPNSEKFYFTTAREGVPDGVCWYWYPRIYSMNVDDQNIVPLGNGVLSNDQTKIAFWQEKALVIWDLDLGEIMQIPALVESAWPGPLSWSPDSQSIVYLQGENDCIPLDKSFVVQIDLTKSTSQLLLESEDQPYTSIEWKTPNQIKLHTEDYQEWEYDLVSQVLTRVK